MFFSPFLSVFAPVADLADPPPIIAPSQPTGASRIAIHTGVGLSDDIGWEIDLGVVGSAYLFQRGQQTETASTVWTQLQATHYMPAESEMVADRYWVGPFARGSIGAEMIGRHGVAPGALRRLDAAVGLRGEAELGASAAIGIGWSVIHDEPRSRWTQGMHIVVDLVWR